MLWLTDRQTVQGILLLLYFTIHKYNLYTIKLLLNFWNYLPAFYYDYIYGISKLY